MPFIAKTLRSWFIKQVVMVKLCKGKHPRQLINSFYPTDPPVKKAKVELAYGKVKKNQFSNLTAVSLPDKRFLNKTRFNMMFHLKPLNRGYGKIRTIELAMDNFVKEGDEQLTAFNSHYSVLRSTKTCFYEYTLATFYHKMLNMSLRAFNKQSIGEFGFIGFLFSDIYLSIREEYPKQFECILGGETATFYRGCQLLDSEIEFLSRNIGECIQLEGFSSTSLKIEIGKQFTENVFL